jgi:hypothetical protein
LVIAFEVTRVETEVSSKKYGMSQHGGLGQKYLKKINLIAAVRTHISTAWCGVL